MTEERGEHRFVTLDSDIVYTGRVMALRRDLVAMPGGGSAVREVLEHPGAVAVVALDDQDRITMIHQYRHPLGIRLWELPAGLLDDADEDASAAAARELAEEVGLTAASWSTLVEIAASPGCVDEVTRVYLARDLARATALTDTGDEEADLVVRAIPLTEAVRMVFAGEIINSAAVAGVLATRVARLDALIERPAEADWPTRPFRFATRSRSAGT
jgi:ADP-ribose pyrophosphatase